MYGTLGPYKASASVEWHEKVVLSKEAISNVLCIFLGSIVQQVWHAS